MSLRKKILTRTTISVLIFALYLLPTAIDLWEENITFFGKIAQRENKFKRTSMSLIEKMYINDIIIVHPKSVKRKHFVNISNA